jgi:hypothetical protein
MKKYSLFAVNYAFQNAIRWGSSIWNLSQKNLVDIRKLIVPDDYEATGRAIWTWFHKNYNGDFFTDIPMSQIGKEFMKYLNLYDSEEESVLNLSDVTRVEVIDKNGRSYVNRHEDNQVSYSLQDDDRTLKIFITELAKDEPNEAKSQIIKSIMDAEEI